MKKYMPLILLLAISLSSCEEVIDVRLAGSAPVLVAEGSILHDSVCSIKLTYTSNYFDTARYVPEENARVSLMSDDERFEILEYQGEGLYQGNIIRGKPGFEYTLNISAGGNEYQAVSLLNPRPELLHIAYEILDVPHFSGETIYTIKNVIIDKTPEESYYLLKYHRNGKILNDYFSTYNDTYLKADTIVYSDYRLDFYRTDTVKVDLYAIDRATYIYFNLVNDVLFSSMSASTPYNPSSNFSGDILGYFMAASVDSETIIIQ